MPIFSVENGGTFRITVSMSNRSTRRTAARIANGTQTVCMSGNRARCRVDLIRRFNELEFLGSACPGDALPLFRCGGNKRFHSRSRQAKGGSGLNARTTLVSEGIALSRLASYTGVDGWLGARANIRQPCSGKYWR